MDELVEISEVTKRFAQGRPALDAFSMRVPPGHIWGLLGPNGAGKTTLFRLLMGILKANSGQLLIEGKDAFEERIQIKRLVGYLPDDPVFYSYLRGVEILEMSSAMHGLDMREAVSALAPFVKQLDMMDALSRYAEDYSRGMKKKLGLLLALIHKPKLLILDEPTNGLDVQSTHHFYDILRELAAAGTSVLFSTHLMDHVDKLCSHATIIQGGKHIRSGSLEELREAAGASTLEEAFLKLTRPPSR